MRSETKSAFGGKNKTIKCQLSHPEGGRPLGEDVNCQLFGKKGFTLIELLVVITIIGILATIILFSTQSARNKAALNSAKEGASNITKGISLYYLDCQNRYPDASLNNNFNGQTALTSAFPPCNSASPTQYVPKMPENGKNNITWAYSNPPAAGYTGFSLEVLQGSDLRFACDANGCKDK